MRLSGMISHRELYFSSSVLILSVVLYSHTSLTIAGSGIQWARRRHTPERLDTITTRNNIRRWTTRIYVIRRTHSSDLAQPHPGKNGEETGNKIVDARNVTNRYDMIVVYDYFTITTTRLWPRCPTAADEIKPVDLSCLLRVLLSSGYQRVFRCAQWVFTLHTNANEYMPDHELFLWVLLSPISSIRITAFSSSHMNVTRRVTACDSSLRSDVVCHRRCVVAHTNHTQFLE